MGRTITDGGPQHGHPEIRPQGQPGSRLNQVKGHPPPPRRGWAPLGHRHADASEGTGPSGLRH